MLYQIEHGTVSLGGRTILSDFSFEIHGTEKIALTGANGAGKTTLLSVIMGEIPLDRDDHHMGSGIRMARRLTIDLLRQTSVEDPMVTVQEHLLREYCIGRGITYSMEEAAWLLNERERYEFETEYDRLFTGFGFHREDKERRLGEFSGGQQTRIALIRLLLKKPDILLLDEPTNHLDVETVQWLEEYLRTYEKAVVMVSHDRYFLDRTAEVVYEIRRGKAIRYPGNYTAFRLAKQKKYELDSRKYKEQEEEIARLDELIRKFRGKPRKASFARSRQKILERMERMEKPDPEDAPLIVPEIQPGQPGSKWVWETEKGKIGYDRPIRNITMRIRRGQKIGIVGSNGTGKSTLLRTIAGQLPLLQGKANTGLGIEMGYFDQNAALITSPCSVLEYFREQYPALTEKEARQILGIYGFRGIDAMKPVDALSGGEKARLVLCCILQRRPNLLLLDEPTNHMDIRAIEMLETILRAYKGTLVLVSHDRYFLDRVAENLVVFPEGEEILFYPFSYTHYQMRRTSLVKGQEPAAARTAEEQALIEGLKAVPKKETGMLRTFSTEALYEDWRFRLAEEQLEEAEDKLQKVQEEQTAERYWMDDTYREQINKEMMRCNELVTLMCLNWYDIMIEFDSGE